jgi:membrane-bound lytic murein transglycosylase D
MLLITPSTYAIESKRLKHDTFPIPDKVARQVWFWESIFKKYNRDTTVIHDWHDPELILDVLDFKQLAQRFNRGQYFTTKERRHISSQYIKRYQLAVARLAKEGKGALKYGAMEQRIYKVYFRNPAAATRVLNNRVTIRAQEGLSDEFARAAMRARDYIPYMEKIFEEEGLPKELTRIAFVESMFNPFARSKVGAAGIWQFMDSTAKNYMMVSSFIDERHAPLKATRAAAQLLKLNYRLLNSWPLAVTAYNFGAAGLIRASKQFKTKDIGTIINNYQGDRFGFASRNFYAEFLAARNVYREIYEKEMDIDGNNPLNISRIKLPKPISVAQLVKHTPLRADILREYNLCLMPPAFGVYQNKLLPANFELIIPKKLEGQVKYALNNLNRNNDKALKR